MISSEPPAGRPDARASRNAQPEHRRHTHDDQPRRADEPASLTDLFWLVARDLRGRSRDTLAPWELAPSHARALMVVFRRGQIRLSDLAERLRIAPRSATEVVDALEERGLVERRPDPADRRATLVALTPTGKRAETEVRAAREAESEQFFGQLSAKDQTELARILQLLHPPGREQ